MTRARLDGLYLLLTGTAFFLLLGFATEISSSISMLDFKVVYFPARCLIQHGDPYKEKEVFRIYQAEGVHHQFDTAKTRQIVTRYMYLPSAFCLTVPFALLPWGASHLIWLTLTVGSIIVASFLIWNVGVNAAPIVSGALIGFFLANSENVIGLANAAGIAVGLCVIAVWCFLQKRFVPAGILCLAISLALKPQDAGLVWLYFLLAGGAYRKDALKTLLVTAALSLPALLWVWQVAPGWMQEWNSNILVLSAHGGLNDPGPASSGARGLGMLVSLQPVISAFRDDPRIYNLVSYLVCAPLLATWAFVTMRSRSSPARAWLALAAIAALSMLPVYHRQQDTKLILLTVPGCAMLWAEGSLIGWLAVVVNAAVFLLTGDLPWVAFLSLTGNLHINGAGLSGHMLLATLVAMQVFAVPLALLAMGIFYVWVYARHCSVHDPTPRLPGGAGNLQIKTSTKANPSWTME